MDFLPGEHRSLWLGETRATDFSPQTLDIAVDVAVIGGGIVGLITAFILKRAGLKVCVLERRRLVTGASGHTTAKITSQHGLMYRRLRAAHGREKAALYGQANQAGLEWIVATAEELAIECALERAPAYAYATSDRALGRVEDEAATALALGLPASFTTETELPFKVKGAVRFADQAHFNPRSFLLGLADTIPGAGSEVYELTQARDVRGRGPLTVETDRGRVAADAVVVATHLPFLDRGLLFARTAPRRHAMVALRSRRAAPQGMYLAADGSRPHSVRPYHSGEHEYLVVTGGSWKTGHGGSTAVRWRTLIEESRRTLEASSIDYRWGAQDYYSADLLPYVGRLTPLTERLYTATGFGAWGMANGAAAGILLADLVLGKENPWKELYDPQRLTLRSSARRVATENLDAAARLVLPRLRSSKAPLAAVHEGGGRVVDLDGERVAVSRSREGELRAVTPNCTHQGCRLRWNDGEESWDCPCHGSRFTPTGAVVQGPATRSLDRVALTPQGKIERSAPAGRE
jgi:glycine/D-amino acid oxidase-like deaminating enzyme/nitrite reductase/ring-hydroxylating ferredoxin subunit